MLEQKRLENGSILWSYVGEIEEEAPNEPEIPPECHNTRPVDAQRCIEAVRAMCGG